MEILALSLVTALLVFLGRVGFILYEVLSMDFNFNQPRPAQTTPARQPEVFVPTKVQPEATLEVLNKGLIPG